MPSPSKAAAGEDRSPWRSTIRTFSCSPSSTSPTSACREESPKKLNDDLDKDILSMLSQKQKIDAETSSGLKGSQFFELMPVVKTPSECPSRTYAAMVAECVRLPMQPITRSGANSYAGLLNGRGTSQTCLPRARTTGLSEPRESQAECKVITHCTWRSQSSEE